MYFRKPFLICCFATIFTTTYMTRQRSWGQRLHDLKHIQTSRYVSSITMSTKQIHLKSVPFFFIPVLTAVVIKPLWWSLLIFFCTFWHLFWFIIKLTFVNSYSFHMCTLVLLYIPFSFVVISSTSGKSGLFNWSIQMQKSLSCKLLVKLQLQLGVFEFNVTSGLS